MTARLVWEHVEADAVTSPIGRIIFDDSVFGKNHSHNIKMVRLQYSSNTHCLIKSIAMVNCLCFNPNTGSLAPRAMQDQAASPSARRRCRWPHPRARPSTEYCWIVGTSTRNWCCWWSRWASSAAVRSRAIGKSMTAELPASAVESRTLSGVKLNWCMVRRSRSGNFPQSTR